MTTNLRCWWHRRILRHVQAPVMNGATEPGTWCWCDGYDPRHRAYWFPSDGGHGPMNRLRRLLRRLAIWRMWTDYQDPYR